MRLVRFGTLIRVFLYGGLIVGLFLFYSLSGIKPYIDTYVNHKANDVLYKIKRETPRKQYQRVQADYRLQPDQRLVRAFAYVQRLAGQGDVDSPSTEFVGDHWQIRVSGNDEPLTLPALPEFAQALALLRPYTASLAADMTWRGNAGDARLDALEKAGDTYNPLALHTILSTLNDAWSEGVHRPRVIRLAASVLVRLSFVTLDDVAVADDLKAKALALLVLAQTISGVDMAYEESLIAFAMGYKTHALRLARQLPDEDPWRLYIEHKDRRLLRAADAQTPGKGVGYLALLRAAELNDKERWGNLLDRSYVSGGMPVHLIATSYYFDDIDYRKFASTLMPHLILAQMVSEKDRPLMRTLLKTAAKTTGNFLFDTVIDQVYKRLDGDPTAYIDYFELWMNKPGGYTPGLFFDEADYREFYRGYFFSALYRLSRYFIDEYSSLEYAEKFAASLDSSRTEIAAQFKAWLTDLIEAQKNRPDLKKMTADIDRMGDFGAPPILRLLDEQLKYYGYGSPQIQPAIRRVMKKMDSRPDHRFQLANLLRGHLYFFSRAEELGASLMRTDSMDYTDTGAWLARYFQDEDAVWAIVDDAAADPSVRAYALAQLEYIDGVDMMNARIGRNFRKLIAIRPSAWRLRKYYVDYLENQGFNYTALHEVQNWLQSGYAEFGSFHYLQGIAAVSRLQVKLGHTGLAVAAALPTVPSYYGRAVYQAIDALVADGRYPEAERVAEAVMKRYPDSITPLMKLARVYWSTARYEQAAELIKQWPYKKTDTYWTGNIAVTFRESFVDHPQDIEAAFSALIGAGLDKWNLMYIPAAYAAEKQYALAFDLMKKIHIRGAHSLPALISSYRYLALAEGRQAATRWMDRRIPASKRNYSSMIFYNYVAYSLLWDLIPHPEQGRGTEYVWLMRAAAYIEGADINEAQRQSLLDYYHHADDRHYHRIGKYLLGLIAEDEILDTVLGPKELCETSYFIGLKKLVEGEVYAAADWFQVSIRNGTPRDGEYRWATDRMREWYTSVVSLDVLAKKKAVLRRMDY